MKKSLLMVLLLITLAATSFAGLAREGAKFVLQTKDGQTISGELLAVKHSSLILKDTVTSIGITVDINDLEFIRLIRNPKTLSGIAIGTVLGVLAGYVVGHETLKKEYYYYTSPIFGTFSDNNESSRVERGLKFAIIGSLGLSLIGGGLGAMAGFDRTISVAGQPETEIQWLLKWLRSRARYEEESY